MEIVTHSNDIPDAREERGPTRTCVGCRTRAPKEELVRLALPSLSAPGTDLPEIAVDLSGKLPGRGVHLHPTRACATAAIKRGGLAQALKRAPKTTAEALIADLAERHRDRAMVLLGAARRAGRLAMGTEAVREAIAERRVELLVVAHDAEGRREELMAAMSRPARPEGGSDAVDGEAAVSQEVAPPKRSRVLVLPDLSERDGAPTGAHRFGSKGALGSMFGRDELAVLGVLDRGLADHVADAMGVASELTAAQRTEAR